MNMNVSKTNTGKLLVAILAMAMIIAGAAVVFSNSVSAAEIAGDETGVANLEEGNNSYTLPATISEDLVINGKGNTISIATTPIAVNGANVTFNNVTITTAQTGMIIKTDANTNASITFNDVVFNFTGDSLSTIYIDDGNSATFNNCTFTGVTVAYNQSTGGLPDVQFSGTTEGNPGMDIQTVADASIGSDIITSGVTFGTITLYETSEKATNLIVPSGEVLNAESVSTSGTKTSTITVEEGGNILVTDSTGIENIVKNENPSMGISDSTVVFADDVVTFAGSIYLTGDLTIPEGKTLVFASGSSLNLNKFQLTVEGTLSIESGAYVMDTGSKGIVLTPTGTVENQGVIGYQSNVKVSAVDDSDKAATGYVTMMNVEGASFGIETTYVGGKSSSTLTVSGDIYATTGNVSSYTITVADGTKIIGTFSIDDGVEFTSTNAVVAADATFTLDGDMAGAGLFMADGSTVVINGNAGTTPIKAQTGKFLTSAKNSASFQYAASQVTLNNIAGVTLSVSSTTFTENRSNMTEQVLYISGTATLIDDTKDGTIAFDNTTNKGSYPVEGASAVAFDGIAKVAADATLVLDEKNTFTGAGIIVLGEIQYPATSSAKTTVSQYVGTNYTVKESASVTTGYITAFETALGAIDTAENKKITVYGELEIETGFELADGQTIVLSKSDIAAVVTIGSDAKVTANKGSAINGAINEVEGILFVQKGATVTKPVMYAVSGTNATTGDVTYAGFEAAIANSVAGDKITVVAQGYPNGTLTVENSVEIPADRTVVIDNGKTVAFEKNLTIAEGAELVNKGTVQMTGEKATITVNGTFDNTAGQLSFDNKGGNVNVSGEYIVADATDLPSSGYSVNGAYYNNKGKTVVTTFAKAVAGAAEIQGDDEITVIGKVSESGEVTVDGDYVTISGEAALGTIRIVDTKVTVSSGSLTATVIGSYGADGSASDASVGVSKATAIIVENTSDVDAMNVTTWYTSIDAVSGAVTVSGGEIVYGNTTTISLNETNTLKVASGATLVIPEGADLDINSQYFTVEGTLAVEGTLDLSGTTIAGTVDVTGTMTVPDTKTLTVTGTIAVSEDEEENATFTVAGTLVLGKEPKVLGTTTTGTVTGTVLMNAGTIVAYNGAAVSNATIVDGTETAVEPTALVVNGYTYATVYDNNANAKISAYDSKILALDDIEDGQTITWHADGAEISGDTLIGEYATVSTELKWAGVTIVVSAGPGLEIYIDDVERNGNTSLSVGEHTVTVYVKAGYTGTPTVTFNGQDVTGSTFTITSDMIGENVVLYATGASPATGTTTGGDDGMGLTEILLIILVVLIVIMAIMVALRLMRS